MDRNKAMPRNAGRFTAISEKAWEIEKAERNLKKLKKIESSRIMYTHRMPNGTIVSASSEQRLNEIVEQLKNR